MFNIYIDNTNKVMFWYTPKCGCTFIRKLYSYYNNAFATQKIFKNITNMEEINGYKNILFTRNIYKRIVSGYLDCYVQNKKYDAISDKMTFSFTLDNLLKEGFNNVNELHFQYTLSHHYNENIVFDKVYDIEKIDYNYLSSLFGMTINDKIINAFRISGHHVKYDKNLILENADKMTPEELNNLKNGYPKYESFINDETKSKIDLFYKNDIEFFSKYGLNY